MAWTRRALLLAGWAALELVSYLRWLNRVALLAAYRTGLPRLFDQRKWAAFFIERMRRERRRRPEAVLDWVSHCFWGVPVPELGRGTVKRMLTFMTSTREEYENCWTEQDLADGEQLTAEVDSALSEVTGRPLEPGSRGGHLPFIRVNNPHTNHGASTPVYQPIPVQLARAALRRLGSWGLCQFGFEKSVCPETGLVFWVRAHAEPEQGRALVMLHGVGLGAVPYVFMFSKLAARMRQSHRTFIIPELPMISGFPARQFGEIGPQARSEYQRPPFPRPDEIAESIAHCVRRSGHTRADFVCHSFGACVASYVSSHQPEIVGRVAFLEPVCFFPDNTKFWIACYQPHSYGRILRLLCRGELTQALVAFEESLVHGELETCHVCRSCIWLMQHVNREELLGPQTMLLLSSEDKFVASGDVQAYMERYYPAVSVHMMQGWNHGWVLLHTEITIDIVSKFLLSS